MVRRQDHGGDGHHGDKKPGAGHDEHADVTESTVEGPVTGSDVPRFDESDLGRVNGDSAQVDDETPDEPVDLSVVQSDDALLNMLSGAAPAINEDAGDTELQALLLSWREETEAEALPDLIDVEAAAATIVAAKRKSRKRQWHLTPVSAAAAVLVVAFLGMGLAAKDAQPGDTLFGVTKVLYSEHAKSVTAAIEARKALNSAQVAINDGKVDEAKAALQRAKTTLNSVAAEDGRDSLAAIHTTLSKELVTGQPPTGTSGPSSSTIQFPPSQSSAASSDSPTAPPSSSMPPSSSSKTPSPSTSSSTTPSRPSQSGIPSTAPRPSDWSSTAFTTPQMPSAETPGSSSNN